MHPSPYDIYNACLQNGWTTAEAAEQFGMTAVEIKLAVEAAGGTVSQKGKVK